MRRIFRKLVGAGQPARAPAPANGGTSYAPDPALVVTPGAPVVDRDLPRASIVILNLNGKHHLQGCFESLAALDYPKDRLEVLLVDNGSDDGSVEELRERHAWVRLEVNERNVGFAAGCNQGAALARSPEVLVFLNNDMRVARPWLRELVAPIVRGECSATTAKMYSWDGKLMNSAGGGMNFHGIGIQRGYGVEPGPEFDVPIKTLFACGGAMAMDAAVYREVGGFDAEFFAYYEDVDLGWRTWVQGHETRYVPTAVCWHHHSSTSRRLPAEMIRLLQSRNPLLAAFKNYDEANLRAVLAPILALHARRTWMMSGLHQREEEFRIEAATNPKSGLFRRMVEKAQAKLDEDVPVRRIAAADLIGVNDLLGRWDHWMARRDEVQARRRRADAEIFRLFLRPRWCIEGEQGYVELQRGIGTLFGLDTLFPPDTLPDPKG
ncbi:MAG: glycosyltransferase family 2 protein [Planctomycetes bacterium]|nr:glycosyltransferase family 2 protein [Planctomycetota bacterium]